MSQYLTTLRCAMCRSCYQGGAVAYISYAIIHFNNVNWIIYCCE
ncbi:hypothetical protein HMPREF9535_03740 [Escherichia coli MS 78-1]|nr:hypothetical protein HMPREF9535_03740 [Escherichia coli MS 78-1]ESA69362.1 hypothetical protein HMPREF1588_03877 [Escherichia coli 110957]